MKIWKFPIECNGVFDSQLVIVIEMPAGAIPLCVKLVNNQVVLYAEVNERAPTEKRNFYCIGTARGSVPTGGKKYLDTVVTMDGAYVWHIYY